MSSRSCRYDYFELSDGRFWSTAGASFVDPCAVMANASRCVVFDDLHLAKTLREEGYPLGEYEGYEPAVEDAGSEPLTGTDLDKLKDCFTVVHLIAHMDKDAA